MTPTEIEQMRADMAKRAEQFRMMQLPGQPMGMHMGTFYLVNDMEKVISAQAAEIARLRKTYDQSAEEVAAKPEWNYFQGLVNIARRVAVRAAAKFPQPNYVTLKIAEEAGEVVRAACHYAEGRMGWDEVQGEIIQLLAMLIRFVSEGDQVNGIKPPDLVMMQSWSLAIAKAEPMPLKEFCDYATALREAMEMPELRALVDAATPYISPVQNADYARQLRQHEALVAALAALKGASHE